MTVRWCVDVLGLVERPDLVGDLAFDGWDGVSWQTSVCVSRQDGSAKAFTQHTVVNLSQRSLTPMENQGSLQRHELRPHPSQDSSQRHYPVYRTSTQASRQDMSAANQVRIQVLQTLKNAKLPRPNTSKQENAAIQVHLYHVSRQG